MVTGACCPVGAERLAHLDVACALLARSAAGEPYPVAAVPELADAITGIAETLGLSGLPDGAAPGFTAVLDQAKAARAEQILTWCPCTAADPPGGRARWRAEVRRYGRWWRRRYTGVTVGRSGHDLPCRHRHWARRAAWRCATGLAGLMND